MLEMEVRLRASASEKENCRCISIDKGKQYMRNKYYGHGQDYSSLYDGCDCSSLEAWEQQGFSWDHEHGGKSQVNYGGRQYDFIKPRYTCQDDDFYVNNKLQC